MSAASFRMIKLWALRRSFLIPLLVSMSCNPMGGNPKPDTYPDEIVAQPEFVLGQGDFIYPDTTAGLSDLSSYRSTLILSFEGTLDGQPVTWARTYTMLAANDPATRQWTIESSDGDTRFAAEANGMDYDKIGDADCIGYVIKEGNSLGNRMELATFLTGVLGADEAGSDTVNDFTVNHYTFDQRALAEQDISESTGEMWIASEGGYIVKYLLSAKASEDYFGDGVEGTLKKDYELSDVNAPAVFALPDDCPAGMIDAPLLADALNVERYPGILKYHSSTSYKDAVAFYQKELPNLGWSAQEDTSSLSENGALLQFVQGDQTLTVSISPVDNATEVIITIGKTLSPGQEIPIIPEIPSLPNLPELPNIPGFPTFSP